MTASPPLCRLRARWLFPVDQPPIENGVIEIIDGRISGISCGGTDADDLGDVAIIPGLVNAHTHLEFSDLAAPVTPPQPFADWIRGVIATRRNRSGPAHDAIDRGLEECAAAGTTLVGEIATGRESVHRLSPATCGGVIFRELIGLSDDAVDRQMDIARLHLGDDQQATEGSVTRGLSPHAPYSVSTELLDRCLALASERRAPVAMHLAETPEERELISRGTGPLVALLKELGVWRERFWTPEGTIQSYLELLARAPVALVVHGNDLRAAEIEFLSRQPHMSVVYCPRTHHFFGHPPHPWRKMLDCGVNVALGTDSRASNPDLSLWNELQFIRRQSGDAPAELLLELATRRGAAALGVESRTGTLTPGKTADLAVISLCREALDMAARKPAEALLHPENRVMAALRDGKRISR